MIDMGIEGRVFIQFVVDKEGNIIDPVILKGVYDELDQQALNVLASAPKWKPGKQKGRPVIHRYSYTIGG